MIIKFTWRIKLFWPDSLKSARAGRTLTARSPPLNKATSALKGFKKRWFVLRRDSTVIEYVFATI